MLSKNPLSFVEGVIGHLFSLDLFLPGVPGVALGEFGQGHFAGAQVLHGVLLSQEVACAVHHIADDLHCQVLGVGRQAFA